MSASIEERIVGVGTGLTSSLRELLAALPSSPRKATEIQRMLGIKKDVASRMVRATDQVDALAAILIMPGPVPLRQVLVSSRALGVDEKFIRPMESAVSEFELLIRDEIGDRVALDGVISSLMPEARGKQDIICKQSVYRGMSQIKGVCAETMLNTAIIWPSAKQGRLDGAWLLGWFGLKRMRPGAVFHFSSGMVGPSDDQASIRTIEGGPAERVSDYLLDGYSTVRADEIVTRQIGRATHYILSGERVGLASSADVVIANYTPFCLATTTSHVDLRVHGPTMEIYTPSKLAVLDVFVHRDAHVGVDPELRLYDTSFTGLADMNDPHRDVDRIDLNESITPIAGGIKRARVQDIPSYPEMLDHVLRARGLRADEFRGYRCKSKYPVYGSQFGFAFPVPRG